MKKNENLKYELESLSSYDPSDIDNSEFDVVYEDDLSQERRYTACCVDVATRAIARIKDLEYKLGEMEIHLSHKTTLLDSCEHALIERDEKILNNH